MGQSSDETGKKEKGGSGTGILRSEGREKREALAIISAKAERIETIFFFSPGGSHDISRPRGGCLAKAILLKTILDR